MIRLIIRVPDNRFQASLTTSHGYYFTYDRVFALATKVDKSELVVCIKSSNAWYASGWTFRVIR